MCTNCRWVYNSAIRQSVLVKCGKCPACQQEKATHRANRIRNQNSFGTSCLFVTLTYDNNSVPYVWRSDAIIRRDALPVYRDITTRRNRFGKTYRFHDERKYITTKLDDIFVGDYPDGYNPSQLKDLRKKEGRIGVCYYPDLQNFLKRLRINVNRSLPLGRKPYECKINYFACSEYGGRTQRPHFHLLLFIPTCYENIVRSAIIKSWSFGDKRRLGQYTQLARDAASYVSSYVNSNNLLSPLLETRPLRQKHSYSQNFGCMLNCFQLSSILQQADNRTLLYSREIIKDGVKTIVDLPIPKYVINRYFPKFKGYCRTSNDTLSIFGVRPQAVRFEQNQYSNNLIYDGVCYEPRKAFIKSLGKEIIFYVNSKENSHGDFHRFAVRLSHSIDNYILLTGGTVYDFMIDYQRIWNLYESQKLIMSYEEELKKGPDAWKQYYDNIGEYIDTLEDKDTIFTNSDKGVFGVHRGKNIAPTLSYIPISEFNLDPNLNRDRMEHTFKLAEVYHKLCKQKDTTNGIMAEQGHYV